MFLPLIDGCIFCWLNLRYAFKRFWYVCQYACLQIYIWKPQLIFINFLCFFSGFIIILNPFEKGCQRYWVDRCIETYPQSPNITNIDPQLSTVDNHDVWKYSKTRHRLDKWIHLPIHMAFQNLCCVLYQNCFKFSGICYYTPTLKDSITCLYE